MTFAKSIDADATIRIAIVGQLTVGNRDDFKAFVDVQLVAGASIALDCRSTGYIDHAGIGALVSLSKRAKERGALLRLEGVNDDLTELFRLTKLDGILTVVRGVSVP